MAEYEALSPEARAWLDSKAEKFETNAIDGDWKKGADDAVARDALDKMWAEIKPEDAEE